MYAVLFAGTLAVFWPSRSAAFVWDDLPYNLAGNPALMRGDYSAFWAHPYRDFYIPVTYSAWTAIAQATTDADIAQGGLEPAAFHTINILVHAANSVLVFWLLYALTESVWPTALGAALFAVHPLQVESVVWVSELRGLLAAFFSLCALVLHCRYRQTDSARIRFALLASLCFTLALLCKPSATILPVVVTAADVLVYRARLPRHWWVIPLVWVGLAAPAMIIAKRLQPDVAVEFIPSVWGRLAVAADALTFYVGKLLVPWPLSPSYGRTPQTAISWRLLDLLWVIPIAIGYLTWRGRRTFPSVALGAVIAFVSLVPVLGFVPFKGQNFSTVADRYMYMPLVGVALMIATVTARMTMTRGRWLVAAAALAALTVVNVQYQAVWHDELTLWRHAALTYPNQPRVHNNYGAALQVAGAQEDAMAQFDLALHARPEFADAYCNRGNSLGRMHRYSEALSDQDRAIQLDPTDGGCWYNRAVTLFALGRFEESLSDVRQAEQRGYQAPEGFVDAIQKRMNQNSR
jgi:hypothetical protein